MTHAEMIAVIKAAQEGKRIECRVLGSEGKWCGSVPVFNFAGFEYRIKPEPPPKPREFWIVISGNDEKRYRAATLYDSRQISGQQQIHVREVLPETTQ